MADLQFPAFDEVEIGGGIGDNAFPAFDEVDIPDFDSVSIDGGGKKPRIGIHDTLKLRSQQQTGIEPESTAHAIVGNFPINRPMRSADQKALVDIYEGNLPDYKGHDFGAEGGGMGDWLTSPTETFRIKGLDDADRLAELVQRRGDFAKESVRMWRQIEEPKLKPEEREESLKGWLQKDAERELKDRIQAKRAAGKTLDEHERSIWNKMVVGAAENVGYQAAFTVHPVFALATSYADRKARLSTSEYELDDNGNLYLSKAGDDEGTAAMKALVGAGFETGVEIFLGKAISAVAGKVAKGILKGVARKAPATANLIGKAIKKYLQLAKVTKLDDIVGETGEEWVQNVADSGLGLDLKQSEMKGKPLSVRVAEARAQFSPTEVMLSMAFLMGGQAAMSTASATMDHAALNRNLDNSLKLFGGLEDADLKGVSTKDKILMARRVAGTMTPEKVEVLVRHLDAKAQQALKKAYDRQQFYQQAQAEGVEPTFTLGGDGKRPYVDTKSGIGIIPEDGKYRVVNRDGADIGVFNSAGEAIAEAKKQSQINVVLDQQRQKKADYALKEAERLAGGMPVRVFNTEAEMLQEFPEIAESPDYQEGITGVRHRGGMVLILDNLVSPSEVVRTIMHEGGAHEGIRRALGDKAGLDQFLGNLAGEQFELGKRRLKLGGQEFIDQLTEADEALATVYEHRLADPTAYQKSVAWLHNQLRRVAPNVKYTDADIEVLMADAQQKVLRAEGSVERGYIGVDRGYSGADAAVNDARARMSQEARAAEQARRRAMADEANKPRVAPVDDDAATPPKAPTQPQQRGMNQKERRAALIAGMELEGSGVSYPVEDDARHEPDQDRDPAAQVETQAGDTAQQAVRQMESDERLKARYPQEYQDALGAVDGDAENAIGLLREQVKAMEETRRVREQGRTILDKLDNKRTLSPQDVRFLAANDILGPDLYKLGYRRVKATGEWRNIDASADDADAAPTSIAPDTSVVAGQTVTQSPSEAQKKAGNYKKAHVSIDGHDITIENPVGSTRSGKDRNGSEWHNEMKTDYGYIKGTVGHDKDHLDVIIKPGYKGGSGSVFVVDQIDPDTGKFDEHKVVFGADNTTEAIELYESNYAPGWKGGAGITEMDADDFKAWAYDTSKRGPKGGALSPSTPTAPTSPPQRPVADAQAANEQGVSASLSLDSATAEPLPWTVTSKDGSRLVFRSQAEAQAVADKWNRLVPETEAVVNAPSPAPRSPATATPPQVPAKNANPPEIRVSPIVSNTGKNIGVTVVRDANPDRDAERAEVEAALARGEKVPMDVLERFPWMAADEVIKPYVQGLSSLSDKQLRAEEKRIGDELNTWASKTKTIMPDGTLNPALGNRAYFEISNKFAAVNREIDKRKAAPAAPAAPQETIAGTRAVAQRIVNAENALYDVDVWSEEELSRLDKLRQERDKLRQKPKVEVKSPVANLSTEDQKRAKPPELKALYAESGEKPAAAAAPARFPRGAMATTVYNEDGVSYTGRIVSEDSGKGTVTIRATKERKKGLKATAGDYGLDKQGRQITKDVTVPAELVGVIDAVDSGARRTAFERAVMDEIDRKALAELRENIGDQTTVIDQIDKIVEQQDADDADPDEAYEGTRFRKQTETPEFKRWFGGSKVVDADGKPLVVYHGVKDADMRVENGAVVFAPKFDVFDTKGRTEPGAWFSPDPKVAAKYGTPIPFYLKAVAPVREEGPLTAAPENADAVYRMRGKGDSIAQAWEIAVFRPDQIKLATGNRGTFDPDNPDIRFRKASDADNLAEPFPMKPSMEVTKVEDIEDNYNKLMQWKKDVAAWADKAPRVLPFIFTYDESSRPELVGNGHVNVVHANTRNTEKPWRYSSFSHKNGVVDMTPNGHSEFKTKGEAVVEAMSTPGTKYDPSIRFRRSLTEADATAEPVFFSQLRRTLEAKMPNRMTVMALRGMIDPAKGSGIKADEIEWTGLKDFLDGKNPGDYVTKAEALEATKDVEIQEVVKEQTQAELDRQEELTALARLGRDRTPEQDARYEQLARRLRIGKDLDNATKFEQYQLPGGENYRELLLTLPTGGSLAVPTSWNVVRADDGRLLSEQPTEREAIASAERLGGIVVPVRNHSALSVGQKDVFKSPHFNEPNILAHVRFNERQAANGDKTLFLEEVQSDWHQEGREKGYAGTMPGNYADVRTRRGTKAEGESNWFAGTTPQDERWGATEYEAKQNWLKAKQEAGVPDAPFKDTSKGWARLAFKRMLRWAAENGFDRIAWTTGEQQAERYDLSKQIKDLQAEKRKDGSYYLRVYPQNAELQEWSADNDSKLAEMVGKELAAKMARQQPGKLVGYSGLDLKVGGEGMRTFYDKILPSIANNIGKKFGARVEDTKLGTEVDGWAILRDGIPINQDRYATAEQAHTVMRQRGLVGDGYGTSYHDGNVVIAHSLPVTPAMRDSVMQGQTMFRRAVTPDVEREFASLTSTLNLPKGTRAERQAALDEWIKGNPKEYAALEKLRGDVLMAAGYNVGPVWHGGAKGITSFSRDFGSGRFYFSDNEKTAQFFARQTGQVYPSRLKIGKPLRIDYDAEYGYSRFDAANFDELERRAIKSGNDGMIVENVRDYDGNRATQFVVFSPSQIKSADPLALDDSGELITPRRWAEEDTADIRFRRPIVTPEQDAAYLAAAEAGDTATAKRMVDEAAKAAGYMVLAHHGTPVEGGFTEFRQGHEFQRVKGIYFTKSRHIAEQYTKRMGKLGSGPVFDVYLRMQNPASRQDLDALGYRGDGESNRQSLIASGYDGLIDDFMDEIVVFDPSQIKSADPVTRDDAGNVIPLSERFNEASNDIRFRPGPATEDEAPIRTTKRYIADWMSSNQLPEYVTNDTVSNQETLDAAKDTLARHDDAANLLISEIMRKARPLTPVERATLLLEQAMLETDVAKERDAVFAARAKGDAVEESYAQSRYEHLLQSAQVMSQVMGEAGSEAGRALQAIKIGILSDMSLASMMRTAEAANGFQPLSGDQIDQVRKLHDSYQQAVDALGEPDMGPGGATGAATRAMKGLQNKRATLSAEERRARAQDMLDALQAEEGGVKDVESLKSIIEQLADAIIQENPSIETGDFNTKLHAAVIDLVGDFMRPTVDEVRDVFSGYGKVTPLNMEAIAKKKRDLRALDQLLAKRDAIERGEAPLRTGQTRDEQTQEMRDLNKQIQDMMKSLGIKATDPARQIKTPLDALKTRLAHRIEDLNASIRSGRKLVTNETPLIYDDEAKGLMARRDALQETYDSIFKTAVLSDQQRLDAAIKAAERNLASWNERLARAEKGDFAQPAKPGLPESQRLDDLRAQAQRARDEVARLQSVLAPEIAERKAAALYNKALDRRAAEYERRLAEKDFAAKPRKVREMSPEVFKKWKAVEDTKAKWRREMEKWRETQLPLATRLVHKGFAASDLFKAVRASFDWSAFGRQGWWTSLSHPQSAKQAFSDMYSATWSERTALEIREELDERPTAQLRMQAGVFMAAVGGEASFNELEEQNQAIALASFQKAGTILTAGIEASNRAYATYLNRMRADLFDLMMETHPTGKPSLDELKLIGQYVNTATGRGNISKHPELARTLSSVLWSPRLQIARIQMTVGWPIVRAACSGQWWAAKAIAKEYARSLAGMSVVAAVGTMIAALFHDDDDPDEQLIGLDPRGSKFGKVRLFGDTWVDITGGASQYLVLGVKLAKGETINKYGKVSDIRGDDRDWGHSAWNEIGRSLRGKSHPVIGLALDLYAGESMIGEKVTPGYFVKNLVLPLSVQNTVETMVAEGVPVGLAVGIMDSLGFAANGYEMDTFKLCEQRFMDAKASMKAATTQKDREMMFARAPFLRMSSRLDALRLQVHRLDRKAKEFKKAGRDARVIIDKASEYRRQFNETLIEASRT